MVEDTRKTESESLLDELNSAFASKDKDSGFSKYTQTEQLTGFMPTNPYDHAFSLISYKAKDIEKDGMDTINDPMIILGTIEDEKTLRRYQLDLYYLTNMAGMAKQDPMFIPIFNILWTNFRNEIRITSAMQGGERQYQAFHIPHPKTKTGFLFKRRRKKPKEPIEYILPQDEEDEGLF